MKYKELPSEKLIEKLISTSFESPSSNRKVFEWCNKVSKHVRFLENERIKLVQKYGKDSENGSVSVPKEKLNDFFQEFSKILEMDIDENIEKCPVKEDWFEDDKCLYPKDKNLWISPKEIRDLIGIK